MTNYFWVGFWLFIAMIIIHKKQYALGFFLFLFLEVMSQTLHIGPYDTSLGSSSIPSGDSLRTLPLQ